MEMNKKIIIGMFSMLLLGVGFVSASGYFSMNDLHQKMIASEGFEEMHSAMMSGDFEAAEKYHETLDYECPMHELVKGGDVSLDDFQIMHEWMMSGDFTQEKPSVLSNAAWDLHTSHHPEIYE